MLRHAPASGFGRGGRFASRAVVLLLVLLPTLAQAAPLDYRAIAFCYDWYGDVPHDGAPLHWAHDVMPENDRDTTHRRIPGGGDIAANSYPQLGEYSSADPAVVERHMAMIAKARIGVIAVTWLGADDPSFRSVDTILAAADRHRIKVCFQIEPKVRKTARSTADAIRELIGRYGSRPAFYRNPDTGRPLFFVYDSYVIPAQEWAQVLGKPGEGSIRGTPFDADVLGLWVGPDEQAFFETSGFDGFYTYFASRGFSWGNTPEHWPELQR